MKIVVGSESELNSLNRLLESTYVSLRLLYWKYWRTTKFWFLDAWIKLDLSVKLIKQAGVMWLRAFIVDIGSV